MSLHRNTSRFFKAALISGAALLAMSGLGFAAPEIDEEPVGLVQAARAMSGKWMSGDFHQHSTYTDGSTPFFFVMQKDHEYGLDWWANSEHGGGRNRDGGGRNIDEATHFWDDKAYYPTNPIQGDAATSGGHALMWRWQSLRDFVYPDILKTRAIYTSNRIFSGLEWNVPGHEHCSTAVVGQDAQAISAFEYMFDASDDDTSRNGESTPFGTLQKLNGKTYTSPGGVKTVEAKTYPERHADSVAAVAWMEKQYKQHHIDDAWIIFAHIERDGSWTATDGGGYNVEHFRDFNNAAPHICFGFEGAPGHQANSDRGGLSTSKAFGGTYGGVGYYTATVGGLWDALLGEGRNWFNFANSDYHKHYTNCSGGCGDDFFPGEYQKNWVFVKDTDGDGSYSLQEIASGLRSGNSFFVMGDLIDHLEFAAGYKNASVNMGGKLTIRGKNKPVQITIKFKSPETNGNDDAPLVDHIDLIAGEVTGKISPKSADYTKATNESTQVIARFTAADWTTDADGYKVITATVKPGKSSYYRLRGTNLPVNTAWETDSNGNPLADSLATANLGIDGAEEAWKDLWFYSNPVFVTVR